MSTARRQDLPSLVVNGGFGSGLSAWDTSYGVAHVAVLPDSAATAGATHAPRYAADLPTAGWIKQRYRRADALRYPSVRLVEFVKAKPVGYNTLRLYATPETRLDGEIPATIASAFQFTDAEGTVGPTVGSQVAVRDLQRGGMSGPYRMGDIAADGSVEISPLNTTIPRLTDSSKYLGATYQYDARTDHNPSSVATLTVLGQRTVTAFDRFSDPALFGRAAVQTVTTGSPLSALSGVGGFSTYITVQSTAGFFSGALLRVYNGADTAQWVDFRVFDVLSGTAMRLIEPIPAHFFGLPVAGSPVVLLDADPLAIDPLLRGFQPGDVLIFSDPRFAVGDVVAIRLQNDRVEIDVRPIPLTPFLPATNDEDPVITAVTTGDAQAAFLVNGVQPAWVSTVTVDDVAAMVAELGSSVAGRRVRLTAPSGAERVFTLHSIDSTTNTLRFNGAADYIPAGGSSAQFPVTSIATLLAGDSDTVAIEDLDVWFASPSTQLSVARELPLFQYCFTLALSWRTASSLFDGTAELRFIGRNGRETKRIPLQQLANGGLYEDVALADSTVSGSIFRRRIWRFFLESRTPLRGEIELTVRAGTTPATISDVTLLPGDFAKRNDFSDTDDPAVTAIADRRTAIDRLYVVPEPSAIARGTVILYAGGAVCPPGWKAVDGLPDGATDGIETLPFPTEMTYDDVRQRTTLIWRNQSFDRLGDDGVTMPIVGAQDISAALLPDGASFGAPALTDIYEVIASGPVQQRPQPGMSLRVKTSPYLDPYVRRFDYVTVIRDIVTQQAEVAGPAPASGAVYSGLVYPYFAWSGSYRPGEVNFTPVGPPGGITSGTATVQPTGYAGLTIGGGVTSYPVGGANYTARGYYNAPGDDTIALDKRAHFSGLANGAPFMTLTNISLPNLAAGAIVFVRWKSLLGSPNSSTNDSTTVTSVDKGFVAVVESYTAPSNAVSAGVAVVRRYDGNGMVTDQSSAVGGIAAVSDALLFHPTARLTRTAVDTGSQSGYVWSARRFAADTYIAVHGNPIADLTAYNSSGIVLEPSGFLRFGEPGYDPGSMAHAHTVTRGDAPYNENLAPHASSANSGAPSSRVARRHGHGGLGRPAFVFPPYYAALLCVKL